MPTKLQKRLQTEKQQNLENEKQSAGSFAQKFDRSFYRPGFWIQHFTFGFSWRADRLDARTPPSTITASPE
jgi:hypothetical protein